MDGGQTPIGSERAAKPPQGFNAAALDKRLDSSAAPAKTLR
jgi:hypothetical protein